MARVYVKHKLILLLLKVSFPVVSAGGSAHTQQGETMSKDKIEDDAKKIVREETEQTKRSDAPWLKPEKSEQGGFGDLFENMWGDFEDPQDSKKE